MRTLHSSSADSENSDPMDFDNEVLEALAHLHQAPTPPTIVKISPILLSSRSSPPASRGGSNDSSNEHMASYDGDSNCHRTKTRMTIEVLFMQHVPWRTA